MKQIPGKTMAIVGSLAASAAIAALAYQNNSAEQTRIGIEQLHQLDVEATLSDKADELAKLWDSEAVRIQPGRTAEVGKPELYANDQRRESKADRRKTLCYTSETKDVQTVGDWASEWGCLS